MKTFDQYMAETGQQSKLDELRKNFQYDAAKSSDADAPACDC